MHIDHGLPGNKAIKKGREAGSTKTLIPRRTHAFKTGKIHCVSPSKKRFEHANCSENL